jgi:hypothetical protein
MFHDFFEESSVFARMRGLVHLHKSFHSLSLGPLRRDDLALLPFLDMHTMPEGSAFYGFCLPVFAGINRNVNILPYIRHDINTEQEKSENPWNR